MTAIDHDHEPTVRATRPAPSALRAGTVTTLAATIANVALLAIGRGSGVAFLVAGPGGDPVPVTLTHVVVATLLPLAVATGFAAVVAVRSRRWLRALVIAGVVVAVASAGAPLASGADTATGLLLASMHLVAGFAFAAGLWPRSGRR